MSKFTWLPDFVFEGFQFGKLTHTEFIPFTIKFIALAVPGVVLGHYLDQGVYKLQTLHVFGEKEFAYVCLQMMAWVLMFYGLLTCMTDYAEEFQGSVAGIFFVALFFTVQTNYVTNLQHVLGVVDKDF